MTSDEVMIDYTNWRGERRMRRIKPLSVRFDNSEWHEDYQWLLRAIDVEHSATRDFAERVLALLNDANIPEATSNQVLRLISDAEVDAMEAAWERHQERLMESGGGPTLLEQQIAAMKFK